jgi:hypothetical protein
MDSPGAESGDLTPGRRTIDHEAEEAPGGAGFGIDPPP